jgi:hypothetical protein
MKFMWNLDWLKDVTRKYERPTYIVTDTKEDFLARMEGIAKRGLLNDGDNLKCLEILDEVKAVREGADIFETFKILKEWNEDKKR